MKHRQAIMTACFVIGLASSAGAQPVGEALEPSPEELDSAFTAADAQREAARWSNEIIDRSTLDPLGRLVNAADLIVQGSVISQSYSWDDDGVPYTHTTLAVTDVLHGDFTGATYTVVQEGGPARDDSRRAMISSHSRHFSVGEEELLFLDEGRGAARRAGALMRAEPSSGGPRKTDVQFRFRIHEGKVYDENGRGVIVEPLPGNRGHRLLRSHDRNPDKRFSTIRIGDHVLGKRLTDPAPQSLERLTIGARDTRPRQPLRRVYSSSSDVAVLRAAIRNQDGPF